MCNEIDGTNGANIAVRLRCLRNLFNTGYAIKEKDAAKLCNDAANLLEDFERILNRESAMVRELQERQRRAVIALTNPL